MSFRGKYCDNMYLVAINNNNKIPYTKIHDRCVHKLKIELI